MVTDQTYKQTMLIPVGDFDPDSVFNCGQCFRWNLQPDGSWKGIAYNRVLSVRYREGILALAGTTPEDFEEIWSDYFDLKTDYGKIKQRLCSDPLIARSIRYAPGIRILRQETWEAMCSFIISQNNNIPRIRGIILRLCELFGDRLDGGEYAFPSAARLSMLDENDLEPLRSGFRARYILDAARKVASGEVRLAALRDMPLPQAREELQKIKGVGPKVADCTLLFGCGRMDCFPVDVWIRKVLERFYPNGFPEELAEYGGIAQQYLFHYARCCPECGL